MGSMLTTTPSAPSPNPLLTRVLTRRALLRLVPLDLAISIESFLGNVEYERTSSHRAQDGEDMDQPYVVARLHDKRLFELCSVRTSVESHDQGWSSFPEDYNTERNSWTWGELVVRDGVQVTRTRLFTNLHAVAQWQTHTHEIVDEHVLNELMRKDNQTSEHTVEVCIVLRAMFPGWRMYVREATIEFGWRLKADVQ